MLRKRLSTLALSLGTLCLAGNLAASTHTSSNSLSVLGYSYGTNASVYTDWKADLVGGTQAGVQATFFSNCPLGDCSTSFTAGLLTFQVSGEAGSGHDYQLLGNPAYPMVITMPSEPSLTGLWIVLTGNSTVRLTLSDGSTVTTAALTFGSTPGHITFTSPLAITSAEIASASSDVSMVEFHWGTANPSLLPSQPAPGPGDSDDQSAVPEVSTLLLMGGGLFGLSRLTKKRNHLLSF
jgi:hypothetical protein